MKSVRAEPRLEWRTDVGDYVTAIAWSSDGGRLAAASGSGPVHVLDAASGQVCRRLAGHGLGTLDVAWRSRSALLTSAGQDGAARLWEPDRDDVARDLEGGSAWVERLAWSPDGGCLATAAGRVLRVWDPAGELVMDVTAPETIYDLAWRPAGRSIATAGYGGVRIWRLDRPAKARHLQWKGASLRLAWSPTGEYIATGDQDSTVHFWMVATGKDLMASGYDTKVRNLAWDRSGRFLATAGGTDVLVWDCSGKGPAGTTPRGLQTHQAGITALAFEPEGPWLVSGDAAGALTVWNPRVGPRTSGSAALGGSVTGVAWAARNGRLAAATADGEIAVFCVDSR